MPSSKSYLAFILDQLSDLEGITYRGMMGEYILYYKGRIIGGIYDDRLLIKPVTAVEALLPLAPLVPPYEGARGMLLVEQVEDRQFLFELFKAMYDQLPLPKTRC